MTARPQWLVPIADAHATITIDDGLVPLAVRLEMPETQLGVMTPLEAAHLSLALQEASKVAAQMRVKQERRKRA